MLNYLRLFTLYKICHSHATKICDSYISNEIIYDLPKQERKRRCKVYRDKMMRVFVGAYSCLEISESERFGKSSYGLALLALTLVQWDKMNESGWQNDHLKNIYWGKKPPNDMEEVLLSRIGEQLRQIVPRERLECFKKNAKIAGKAQSDFDAMESHKCDEEDFYTQSAGRGKNISFLVACLSGMEWDEERCEFVNQAERLAQNLDDLADAWDDLDRGIETWINQQHDPVQAVKAELEDVLTFGRSIHQRVSEVQLAGFKVAYCLAKIKYRIGCFGIPSKK